MQLLAAGMCSIIIFSALLQIGISTFITMRTGC